MFRLKVVTIFLLFIFLISVKVYGQDITQNDVSLPKVEKGGEFFYSDPSIIYSLRKSLYENIYVGRFNFDIACSDGIVELSGEVDTEKSSAIAEKISINTLGVKSVVNKLILNPSLISRPSMLKDKYINDEIMKNLTTNKRVKIYRLSSYTIAGRATLEGVVDSLEAELITLEVARSVKGVTSVRSNIKIDAGVSDGYILFATKLLLIADPHVNGFAINVDVEDGIIILRGTVDNENSRQIAINKAKGIAGSRGVISYLEIKDTVTLDEARLADNELTSKVEQALKDDKELSNYDIKVKSENGIITLLGTVDTRDVVIKAVEKASSVSGVRAVKSELEIK